MEEENSFISFFPSHLSHIFHVKQTNPAKISAGRLCLHILPDTFCHVAAAALVRSHSQCFDAFGFFGLCDKKEGSFENTAETTHFAILETERAVQHRKRKFIL